MPTTTWAAAFGHAMILADGTQRIWVHFTDSGDGHALGSVCYLVAADGSSVKDERSGLVVASPAPAALVSAGSAYLTQLAAIVASGVSANKIKP